MADFPGWMKNFQRIRTPVAVGSPFMEQDGFLDNSNAKEDDTSWPHSVSRISSYLNLGRSKPPSISSSKGPAQPPVAVDVWHNPDDTQVVETLKVLLMNQTTFKPIPVQYNSCVLQVLEAFGNMQGSLTKTENDLRELTAKQVKEARNLQRQIAKLERKETIYKQEIKNLEVMLATGARGLDVVTTARSKSLVYKPKIRSQNVDSGDSTEGHRKCAKY